MNNRMKRLVKIIIAINVIFCVGCASQKKYVYVIGLDGREGQYENMKKIY